MKVDVAAHYRLKAPKIIWLAKTSHLLQINLFKLKPAEPEGKVYFMLTLQTGHIVSVMADLCLLHPAHLPSQQESWKKNS